jgi:pimeloyl-ACP methyl ester carboxylesterase
MRQSSAATPETDAGKTGVLLLNSGFLPRSAQGDLSARLADKMAGAGFPVFRFDLPGLGDSEGDLPEDAVTFVRLVEKGAFAPYASALAAELVELYNLDKIVMGGLCGGGITSLFGATASKSIPISGIIMLDPTFNLVQVQEPQIQKRSRWSSWNEALLLRTKAAYEELRVWILAQRLGAPLQRAYARLRAAMQSRRQCCARPMSAILPKEANLKLILSFERLAAAGLPILVVTAQNPRRAAVSFDYLDYLLRKGRGKVIYRTIEGTNHSFVEGVGPKAVMELTEEWLKVNFVSTTPGPSPLVKESFMEATKKVAFSIQKVRSTAT